MEKLTLAQVEKLTTLEVTNIMITNFSNTNWVGAIDEMFDDESSFIVGEANSMFVEKFITGIWGASNGFSKIFKNGDDEYSRVVIWNDEVEFDLTAVANFDAMFTTQLLTGRYAVAFSYNNDFDGVYWQVTKL